MGWLRRHIWWEWLSAGFLLGIAFVYPILWVVGLLGAAYFLHLLNRTQSKKSLLLGAWTAWTVKASLALSFYWTTYPIEWLPVEFGNIQVALIFMYWFTSALWLGAGGIALALIYKLLQTYCRIPKQYLYFLIFPFVWVTSEIIGSLVFSIMMIGPGGSVNIAYSYSYGGYLLAEHEAIIQLARLGGVYVLSLLFALGSAFILLAATKQQPRFRYIVIGVMAFIYLTSFLNFSTPTAPSPSEGYKVISIDTTLPKGPNRDQATSAQITSSLNDAMVVALAEDPDFILLPEDARYFNQQRSVGSVKSLFQLQFDNPNVAIIDSGRAEEGDKTVLQTFIYNGPSNPVERIHKRYLVPQGEFLPSLYTGLLSLLGYRETLSYLSNSISYEVGSRTDQSRMASNLPGILFCFESVAPYGVRTLLKERPDLPFVVHPISHAWFHEPQILWHQFDTMLKVQAVWNQQYIVSAGNHVSGQVITPQGDLVSLKTLAEGDIWTIKETVIPKAN